MNSSFWLSQSNQRNSQGNFVMDIWNQLSSVIFVNAGLRPSTNRSKLNNQKDETKRTDKTLTSDDCVILSSGSFKSKFGYRTLESARVVLMMARTRDSRLQGTPSIDKFYQYLERVQDFDFTTQSFVGKTVVAVEGLEGSGKSTLIDCIASHCPGLEVVSAGRIPALQAVLDTFRGMPDPVFRAFQCVANYAIAFEVLHSSSSAFLVENYHHAVCARIVCAATTSADAVAALPVSVFEWPFDLPLPELVLFLSVATEARMMRIQRTADGASAERDVRANLVYSLVRGPGTVGLDASLPADEVAYTALEALEYYGVYAISRHYDPSYVNPAYHHPTPLVHRNGDGDREAVLAASTEGPSAAPVTEGSDDPVLNGELDVHALSPLTAARHSGRGNTTRTAADKHKQKRRSSLCFRPGRKLSNEFGADENADPQAGYGALEVLPELPEEAIKNRRISMGVYGMFSAM